MSDFQTGGISDSLASGRSRADGGVSFMLIGHHRSGTNFLTDVLQAHSRVSFIDEPLSMHTRGFPRTDLERWGADSYHPVHLHESLREYPLSQRFFRDLVSYLEAVPSGQVRGFKETLLFEKIPWLLSAVPPLRIVHVVRDPRAVVASLLKHDVDRQWGYADRLTAYFARHPDSPVEPLLETPLMRCVTSWKVRQYEFRASVEALPVVTVRLEDIVQDDETSLALVMSFLGLEVQREQLVLRRESERETRGGMYSTYRHRDEVLDGWRRRLSPADQAFVTAACEEELHDLGYLFAAVR
ncbi:sulfotransferase [Micromonospora sp. NPDC023633]|uniref:sulfotransferase n=1 Tax=Micromonospora sp. NPDC023633 TaxID=3154320 RepID=UPI003405724F